MAPETSVFHEADSPKLGLLLSLHPFYRATFLWRQYAIDGILVLIYLQYSIFFFISTVSNWLSLNFTIF